MGIGFGAMDTMGFYQMQLTTVGVLTAVGVLLIRWQIMMEPWVTMSWRDIHEEYPESANAFEDYVKHLLKRYEGEVALAWGKWEWSSQPLPRDKVLWNSQYAVRSRNLRALANLAKGEGSLIDDGEDLLAIGNTMILRASKAQDGHWRLCGGAITLAELRAQFGNQFIVSELMFWYHHAAIVVKKRPHS
jgi:hypothetical protein